eukprot:5547278-Lingulodinium_polyedra.AAC.1
MARRHLLRKCFRTAGERRPRCCCRSRRGRLRNACKVSLPIRRDAVLEIARYWTVPAPATCSINASTSSNAVFSP